MIEQILNHWEETGEITRSEFLALQHAVEQGHQDARRLTPLLPLLSRDADATEESLARSRIMQSVLAEHGKANPEPATQLESTAATQELVSRAASDSSSRFSGRVRGLALAASLVLVVGAASLLGYSFGYQRGRVIPKQLLLRPVETPGRLPLSSG